MSDDGFKGGENGTEESEEETEGGKVVITVCANIQDVRVECVRENRMGDRRESDASDDGNERESFAFRAFEGIG